MESSNKEFVKECIEMGLTLDEFQKLLHQYGWGMQWIYDCESQWKKQLTQHKESK